MTIRVSFESEFKGNLGLAPPSNAPYYDFIIVGNTSYAARGAQGFASIDITDKSSAALIATAIATPGFGTFWSYRNVLFIGGFLYTCARAGNGADPESGGSIEKWDVTSNPSVPVMVDEYRLWSATGNENPRYSAMSTDGVYIYVAAQTVGGFKFLASDLASGPVDSIETGSFETQGTATYKGFTYFANYDDGLRIVDSATMGDVVDTVLPQYNSGGVNLRPWECVAYNDTLYVSANSTSVDTPNRGLLTLDISNPASITDWTTFTGYPLNANSTHNGAGDAPQLGLSVLDDVVYVTNGRSGNLMWDVQSRLSPVYIGQQGNLVDPDNLFAITVFKDGTTTYAIYGDGQEPTSSTGTRNVYLDLVNVENVPMAFVIGIDATTSSSTSTSNPSETIALACGPDNFHTAGANEFVDEYNVRVRDSAGARAFDVALYDVDIGLPDGIIAGTTKTISNPNTTNTDWRKITTGKFSNIFLTEGITYATTLIQSSVGANSVIAREVGANGSRDDTVTGGAFNATWTNSQAGGDIVVGALGDVITTAPTLTTPYSIDSPNKYGPYSYFYENRVRTIANIISYNFSNEFQYPFKAGELMWARLQDGWATLEFVSATHVQVI